MKKISAALFLSGTTVLSLGAKLIPPMNVFPIFLKSKPTSQNIILDSEKESSKVSVIDEFQAKVVLAPGLKVVKVVQAGKGFVDRSAGLPKDIRGGVKLFHVRASEIK
ncbi:hypothetical protein HOD08_01135, partial [bacterium]|nr:hypothetical protein [bacterium]